MKSGIAPYQAQSREDVDCACVRYDGDVSFGLLGNSFIVFCRITNSSGMLLCAVTPARTPARTPASPSARTLRNLSGSLYI